MSEERRMFLKKSALIAGGIVLSKLPFSKAYAKGPFNVKDLPNVFIVSNMHPASCGWLVNFSIERNYCANDYFVHMDKVNEDPNYNFVISEVNNMIAILNFQPKRFEELKRRLKEGRIEAVNGMFLELTPNLSGGEAIVRMGVHGIQWQKEILGIKPRFNWMIDITGVHEQFAQIGAGLGLEAQVHCRMNISGSPLYMAESPDGTKLLTISPGHYANWGEVFKSTTPVEGPIIQKLASQLEKDNVLGDIPYLVLGGDGDYSLPPKYAKNPTDFVKSWRKDFSESDVKFSTLGAYVDFVKPKLISGEVKIPTVKEGWGYSWDAFWVENPRVKSLYRSNEHALQGVEMLATIASLHGSFDYPSQDLYHAWLQLHLNTDRNTLWGAAGQMVFEDEKSWDVLDRFNWINRLTNNVRQTILKKQDGEHLSYFNPVNWSQAGPQYITLPKGKKIKGYPSQKIGEQILFFPTLPSFGIGSLELVEGEYKDKAPSSLPETISNDFYEIGIDSATGELINLSLKKSKKIVIQRGAVLCSDRAKNNDAIYHELPQKIDRIEAASLKEKTSKIEFIKGELAQIIKISSSLYRENDVQQTITIYNNHPRIDFDVYLEDLPDKTITFMDFMAEYGIIEESRGIPYGFATESTEALALRGEGVHPATCWSDYKLRNGTGFAVLDRGLPGREITGKSVSMMLNATSDVYMGLPGGWLSGKGRHHFQFAFIAYDDLEIEEQIQQYAWEFNSPPFFETSAVKTEEKSFIATSANIIIESMQRVNDEVEIRFVECLGVKGTAKLEINMPVGEARLTNFLGEGDDKLSGDKLYLIPVRPQQIITVRLKAETNVAKIQPLKDWSPLVPENKREFLVHYDKTLIGHPPAG